MKDDYISPHLEFLYNKHCNSTSVDLKKIFLSFLQFLLSDCISISKGISCEVDFVSEVFIKSIEDILIVKNKIHVSGDWKQLRETYTLVDSFYLILNTLTLKNINKKILDNWNLIVYTQLVEQHILKLIQDSKITITHSDMNKEFKTELGFQGWDTFSKCFKEVGYFLKVVTDDILKLSTSIIKGNKICWFLGFF